MRTEQQGAEAPHDLAWKGIEHCRRGDWTEGLYWLSLAAESPGEREDLPPLFFSFLGHGIARLEGKKREGLELCQRAAELEFHHPEVFRYLAETHLLLDDRRSAFEAVQRGLEIDSGDLELRRLHSQLGERRQPVIPFLPRRHALNRLLGRLRHRWSRGDAP
ncbi:MAG: hypothetical protein AAF725_04345 [Acidobacteriota bacterium]